jgi:hypothetical protein
MPNWDQDESGIIINVITGHETALLAHAGCLLRIMFATKQDHPGSPPHAIQFGMTPKQAHQLADDLHEMANKAIQRPPGGALN